MSACNGGQRYLVARAMGNEELERVVREDEALLKEFGLKLLSVESGLQVAIEKEIKGQKRVNPWNVINFGDKSWSLLRPLLVELSSRRAVEQKETTKMAAK